MTASRDVFAMKKTSIEEIQAGTIAKYDCYSERGELLISQGTEITQRHIDALKRRHIFEIFHKFGGEEDEIQTIISKGIEKLDEVDLEEEEDAAAPPAPIKFPELKEIKRGAEGLKQLNRSAITIELDKILKTQRAGDKPVGPALKGRATEVTAKERTVDYKRTITASYASALAQVRQVLGSLVKGARVEGREVLDVVRRFVKVFVTDRNILLNISGIKHEGAEYVYHHSLNVCLLAINIAASYGYSEKQVAEIGMGALLHDLGMLLIPPQIVNKRGRLTQEEWYEIQKHPVLGLHLLEKVKRLPESVPYVAYQVHERENRGGYPKQRGTRLIHRFAKIVQVADVYEALSSPRCYRPAFIPYEKVVRANGDSFAKPVVSILTDAEGRNLPGDAVKEEDLSSNIDVYVSKALAADHATDLKLMDGF